MNEYQNIQRCITITSDHILPELHYEPELALEIESARGRRQSKTQSCIELLMHKALTNPRTKNLYWTADYQRAQYAFDQAIEIVLDYEIANRNKWMIVMKNGSEIHFGNTDKAIHGLYEFAVKDDMHYDEEHIAAQARAALIKYGVPEEQLDELMSLAKLAKEDE